MTLHFRIFLEKFNPPVNSYPSSLLLRIIYISEENIFKTKLLIEKQSKKLFPAII